VRDGGRVAVAARPLAYPGPVAELSESILVEASLAEIWSYYFEPSGWPMWVDGFHSVESANGYPERGGTLVWRSTPAGRGTVTERVLDHEPRTLHRIAFEDPESSGELTTRFEIEGEATRVTLELSYVVAASGPFAWLTERLFVRGQVGGSLRRTLARLRLEGEELAELNAAATSPETDR
jgi:Polyketide cyclase / dehydrase and lipid transport